jgi:nicotinate-nucleotide adenylyltransferase
MIHPTPYSGPSFAGLSIGLLGGSFNPAHEGHVAMSFCAIKQLRLDQVWWLVSPQNPLKPRAGMASLSDRLRAARALTKGHARLRVTDIEVQLRTRYTIDTITALKKRMPRTRFVWLMGADNLRQFGRWKRWESLFHQAPIAVFRRPGFIAGCGMGKAALRFAAAWRAQGKASQLALQKPPAWMILDNRLNPMSATRIRQEQQQKGF